MLSRDATSRTSIRRERLLRRRRGALLPTWWKRDWQRPCTWRCHNRTHRAQGHQSPADERALGSDGRGQDRQFQVASRARILASKATNGPNTASTAVHHLKASCACLRPSRVGSVASIAESRRQDTTHLHRLAFLQKRETCDEAATGGSHSLLTPGAPTSMSIVNLETADSRRFAGALRCTVRVARKGPSGYAQAPRVGPRQWTGVRGCGKRRRLCRAAWWT